MESDQQALSELLQRLDAGIKGSGRDALRRISELQDELERERAGHQIAIRNWKDSRQAAELTHADFSARITKLTDSLAAGERKHADLLAKITKISASLITAESQRDGLLEKNSRLAEAHAAEMAKLRGEAKFAMERQRSDLERKILGLENNSRRELNEALDGQKSALLADWARARQILENRIEAAETAGADLKNQHLRDRRTWEQEKRGLLELVQHERETARKLQDQVKRAAEQAATAHSAVESALGRSAAQLAASEKARNAAEKSIEQLRRELQKERDSVSRLALELDRVRKLYPLRDLLGEKKNQIDEISEILKTVPAEQGSRVSSLLHLLQSQQKEIEDALVDFDPRENSRPTSARDC